MPKSYEQVQTSLAAGNIMDWTNALNRLNGIPLDPTSIFDNYNNAVIYAATNPVAYVGQVITVRGALYVIGPTVRETREISGVAYDNYLILIAQQKNVEALSTRVEAVEAAIGGAPSTSVFMVIDGGNAAQAQEEAITNE